ncbi:B-box zinc finger protein 21 [Malania oleifera]|uniref:B-box zinc finger protein 21 n=1 Tax=Malania oleifera TaxID=397392 RepID=UPI0025AEAC18|nr:B-box zinc finger protein 21 [Malania oleifera]
MKIQCDGCNKEEASVFCTADEAALCDGCDRRVHHANKLAGKHLRFSLLRPSLKDSPLCDICQERRAFLFCREDRAILCIDCDASIHKANEHTQKHSRFLLAGIKLSPSSSLYRPISTSTSQISQLQKPIDDSSSSDHEAKVPSAVEKKSNSSTIQDENQICQVGASVSTSSIAEYLIKTLPGWQVDDFLDPSPVQASLGFCKTGGDLPLFMDDNLESNLGSFPSEDLGLWVPQIPPNTNFTHATVINGFNELEEAIITKKGSRKLSDDCFTVPQVSKKSRQFW